VFSRMSVSDMVAEIKETARSMRSARNDRRRWREAGVAKWR
jgi:hypothetical protein